MQRLGNKTVTSLNATVVSTEYVLKNWFLHSKVMARGQYRGGGADHWSDKCYYSTRTVWNFQKPAWNVREFYFGGMVGTMWQHLLFLSAK